MTTAAMIEVAVGFALLVGGVVLYRRRGRADPSHGSQTAILMFVAAALLLIHGLGGLDYRPSAAEREALRSQ